MTQFESLLTLADDPAVWCISTAEGVHSHLRARHEVLALRKALKSGVITLQDLESFVRGLLSEFVRGPHSRLDAVLAAVVVAIEHLAPAQEFLEDLARVRVKELPISPRVARLALRERTNRIAQLTQRELVITMPIAPATYVLREERPIRVEAAVDYIKLDLAA